MELKTGFNIGSVSIISQAEQCFFFGLTVACLEIEIS